MKPIYKFFTLIVFIGLIAIVGNTLSTFLPSTNHISKSTESKVANPFSTLSSPSNWKIAVLDSFSRRYQGAPKWSKSTSQKAELANTWVLRLPQGLSFVQYALAFQEIAQAYGAKLEYGSIQGKQRNRLVLNLIKGQDPLRIYAIWSPKILPKVAKLAIVIDKLDPIETKDLVFLSNRNWKPTCIVNSRTQNKSLRQYLRGFHKTEVLLELPLEPLHYPYRNPGPGTIFLHFTQEEIDESLNKKRTLFPKAIGFATVYGKRVIDNRPTMEKIFDYHQEHQLIFLDRTQSKRSLTPFLARSMGVTAFETKNHSLPKNMEEFMYQKIQTTIKYGKNVLVFNYSKKLLSTLDQYFNSISWQKQGVESVHLSQLLKKEKP